MADGGTIQPVISMTIHEPRAMQAARRIHDVLTAWGSRWVAMYIEEGWIIARADSLAGQRILRSGSPSIAGVFDARVKTKVLRDALAYSMRGEYMGIAKRTYPSWEQRKGGAYKRAWRIRRRQLGMKAP